MRESLQYAAGMGFGVDWGTYAARPRRLGKSRSRNAGLPIGNSRERTGGIRDSTHLVDRWSWQDSRSVDLLDCGPVFRHFNVGRGVGSAGVLIDCSRPDSDRRCLACLLLARSGRSRMAAIRHPDYRQPSLATNAFLREITSPLILSRTSTCTT